VEIVYQLTFFLALGLLAIIITVFVFAVSQVGRATETASEEQQEILLKQKEAKVKQIEKIQKQLEEAKKEGHLDEPKLLPELQQELQNTEEEFASYEVQLRKLEERIVLIRRRGAVIYPGTSFISAIILTITASGLAVSYNYIAIPLWIISIVALVFGSYRVFKTLGAIEEVTITSKEAQEKLPDAVKAALRELEEERRPELEITYKGAQPPFKVKAGSERIIEFTITLSKGEIAKDPEIYFTAPPGFGFPDCPRRPPPLAEGYDDYVCAAIKCGNIPKGTYFLRNVKIKAPDKTGSYTLFHNTICEGFKSGRKAFEIVVE